MAHPRERYQVSFSLYLFLFGVVLVTLPGFCLGVLSIHVGPVVGALVFGLAIFGAAFLLSWGAEAAQIDVSESLAVALLALIAVLPEYAVDFVFTWKSAHDPSQAHYAIANMTGSNRLLVGLGWPLVLLLYILTKNRKESVIILAETHRVEIFYLAVATLYSFIIPLKGSLTLIDTAILVTLFALYARRAAQMEKVEPAVIGPVRILANMSAGWRRLTTILLFLFPGSVIFFVAEPFAMSLLVTARSLGLNEFYVVQWLAPLASESPEFIVAATWALRGWAGSALKVLISSKINQWTLLVGSIPLVFAISGQAIRPFGLDDLQNHELILTAAQSLFAVAVLVNLRFSRTNGLFLATLFLLQLFIAGIRLEVTVAYLLLAIYYHIKHRASLLPAARLGLDLRRKSSG